MDTAQLTEIIFSNSVDQLKAQIQLDPEIVNRRMKLGRFVCLLEMAAYANQLESVECLLVHGANPDGVIENPYNGVPLASALHNCNIELIRALLNAGASVARLDDALKFGNALHNSRQDIFELLYEHGFNTSVLAEKSRTPLLALAIKEASSDDDTLVKYLVDQGCEYHSARPEIPVKRKLENGSSVLECLLYRGFDNLIRYVWSAGVSRDEMLPEQRTMLQLLCIYGSKLNPETIELLLDNDLSEDPGNSMQYSAFDLAVFNNNVTMIEYLLDHGADINRTVRDRGWHNALMFAVEYGERRTAECLFRRGIDLNYISKDSLTVLDMLHDDTGYMSDKPQFAKELEEAGARRCRDLIDDMDDDQKGLALLAWNIEHGEVWSELAIEQLSQLEHDKLAAWNALLEHCQTKKSSKPSARWLKQADKMLDAIGRDAFSEKLFGWLDVLGKLRTKGIRDEKLQDGRFGCGDSEFYAISFNNTLLLKSLIWLSVRDGGNSDKYGTLREVVRAMFKKIPDVGIRNAKIGNAALYALSQTDDDVAIAQIALLNAKTKYGPAKKYIEKVYQEIADRRGVSQSELDQMARESIKLTRMGEYEKQIGDYTAVIRIKKGGVSELLWKTADKTQKTLPAAIKNDKQLDDAVKELKALKKDIDSLVATAKYQLEQMYVRNVSLNGAEWRKKYIDDYLTGTLGQRLIWQVGEGDATETVMYVADGFISAKDELFKVTDDAIVRLWHPMMSDDSTRLAIRDLVIKYGIVQPFKQAHREIYALSPTESEEHQTGRFAGHIIRQHQFHALAEQRGWKQTRVGAWDGGDDAGAFKVLPGIGLTVYLDAEPEEDIGDNINLYEYLSTGNVHIADGDEEIIPLGQIDKLLISEVFRDIDLMISVSSVVNVPDWEYRESIDYWKKFGFGELSEIGLVRKSVLESILPSLKHADRFSIEGDYMVVQGSLHRYRIHIGSTSVLMGNDETCLSLGTVRRRAVEGIPFDDDSALTMIVSTALMLAEDNKIKDKDILAQIKP